MEQARALRDALRQLLVAHQALRENQRPCGQPLPLPQAHALLVLLPRGPLRIKELSAQLNIDGSNVSRLCARMEAEGLLERRRDPEDGRAWRVALTVKGRALAQSVDQSSAQHFARLIQQMDDPTQVIQAMQTLATLMQSAGEQE